MTQVVLDSDAALEAACGTGVYEWGAAQDRLVWSPGLMRLYGLTEAPSGEGAFSSLVHPQDRVRVEAETSSFLGGEATTYSHQFRIVRSDGAVRSILDRGAIERDQQGRVQAIRGMNVDVTDLWPTEEAAAGADETTAHRIAELETLYSEAPLGLAMLDRDLRFVRINHALAEINGHSVEEHLGRQAWDLVPNLRESAEPALRQVLETGLPLRDVAIEGETPARPGIARQWREHFYPLRGVDGAIHGIGIVCEEVTEKRRVEAAIRESEARFRGMADSAPVMVWMTEPDGSCTYLNALWHDFTGQEVKDALGYGWLEAVHPDDAPETERAFNEATASRQAFRLEYRLRRADGAYCWAIDSARPRLGEDGEFLGFIGSVIDINERMEAEQKLRAAHDTFRRLVDGSPFGIYAVDADFRLVQASEGSQKVFEKVRPLLGRDLAEVLRLLWPEPFASEAIAHFRHTLATGAPHHAPRTVERRIDTGATEAYDWKLERVTMPDGRAGVVCHFYDLSERQAHERKIEYLMREVNHRAKNMLALVDAVARQTVSSGQEDFVDRFSERIRAMAASQDLLVQTDWEGTDLAALIESQLLHFKDLVGRRIRLNGPRIELSPSAAQTLGMAVHELATNAAKYGALSNERGGVEVAWQLTDGVGALQFSMTWSELGGPRVKPPTRSGFGSRVAKTMVERALAGRVALEYAEGGVLWTLRCPLSSVISTKDHLKGHSDP